MLRLAYEVHVPAVLTNAVRYLDPADGPVAQVLDAARRLVPLGRSHRDPHNARAYLASGAEMARIAARICEVPDSVAVSTGRARRRDQASFRQARRGHASDGHAGTGEAAAAGLLADTAGLVRRCALDPQRDMGIGGRFLPETVGDPLALLRARCEEGLDRHFPRSRGRAARRRLDHELAIITRTGLASYFLTVADVVELIRGHGGPLRGPRVGCRQPGHLPDRRLRRRSAALRPADGAVPVAAAAISCPTSTSTSSRPGVPRSTRILARYGGERCRLRRDDGHLPGARTRSAMSARALGLPPGEIDAVAKAFPHIRAEPCARRDARASRAARQRPVRPQLDLLLRARRAARRAAAPHRPASLRGAAVRRAPCSTAPRSRRASWASR